MILQNPYSNCTNARLYYYDFLSERTRTSIPESALCHIKECDGCQAEIERLEILLAHADEYAGTEQHRQDAAIGTLLKLHFAHAEAPVTCSMVKPFLASLADPVLAVRVSTPITMHVEKCRACSSDLLTLRNLHLTHKQLCRLGRILSEEPGEDPAVCSRARMAIPAVVSMVLRETNAETLKHLCTCPDCRKHLYRRREAVRQKLPPGRAAQDGFPCEAVSPSDVYDCALPYGIDPANDPYAEFRAGLISHLADCPDCLARVQQLHRAVSTIAERPESNVVTVYHLDKSARTAAQESSSARRAAIDFAAGLKRRFVALKAKPLLGPGLAAAAVVLIGLAVLLNAPSATAVSMKEIYSAVEGVRNAHITTSTSDMQEQWVSESLKIHLVKTGASWVLYDLGSGVTKSKDSLTGETSERQLAQEEIAAAKERMNITLALMPFDNLSAVSHDAQWAHVAQNPSQIAGAGSEVYDLTWTESTSVSTISNKCRFVVDPETKLPRKIELYQKRFVDTDYSLKSVTQVEYLTDPEMEAVLRASF